VDELGVFVPAAHLWAEAAVAAAASRLMVGAGDAAAVAAGPLGGLVVAPGPQAMLVHCWHCLAAARVHYGVASHLPGFEPAGVAAAAAWLKLLGH
jgi:hypothetical protein